MKRALFIAGPTAGGKSALALELSERLNGVIINADSMQVYKDLSVVTACPSADELAAAPHQLYQFLDGATVCTVTLWMEHALEAINLAWMNNQTPILVGGTGMYFKMLLEGIVDIPEIPTDIRREVRQQCETQGSAWLHHELKTTDPEAAKRLPPGDSQRVCRAVEVYRATGRALSDWHKDTKPGPLKGLDEAGQIGKHILLPERDILYRRCNLRFDKMLEGGALAEVETLMSRNLSDSLPVMRALGVPSLISYLRGVHSLNDAVEEAKMQTRRFAKRQLTWFRNQFSDWNVLSAQYLESQNAKIINKIIDI